MRWPVLILTGACTGSFDLHGHDDPPPHPCNGAFTWGDPLLDPSTATVYTPAQNPGALTFRLTASTDACAEVNADATGDFLEISIDGAGTQCMECKTASCDALYQSQVHAVRVRGAERTDLGRTVVAVVCDNSFAEGGPARASIDLSHPDAGGLHFMIVSPRCNVDNDCPIPR